MRFDSYAYVLAFLPAAVAGYFALNGLRMPRAATLWLTLASLAFYAFGAGAHLPLLLASVIGNFILGRALTRSASTPLLVAAVLANLAPLAWYKATAPHALPLAVSFFTFQQLAFLVDCHWGRARADDLLEYASFATFFPRLIAGPITRRGEDAPAPRTIDYERVGLGLALLSLGLCKKTLVADKLGMWAALAFDGEGPLTFVEAWLGSVSYTLQLYFDFSGYTDMALGSALMLNIVLPANFASPYKALDIADFWRRWHMSLSRWFLDYVFMPLQLAWRERGALGTVGAVLLTFLLCGLWHGTGWGFIIWGLLHGVALIVHTSWRKLRRPLPNALAWFVTFQFINAAWVFFRAPSPEVVAKVFKGMSGLAGVVVPVSVEQPLSFLSRFGVRFGHYHSHILPKEAIPWVAFFLALALFAPSSGEFVKRYRPTAAYAALTVVALLAGLLAAQTTGTFLYFDF